MRKNFNEAKTKRTKKRNPLAFMTVDFEMWGLRISCECPAGSPCYRSRLP